VVWEAFGLSVMLLIEDDETGETTEDEKMML